MQTMRDAGIAKKVGCHALRQSVATVAWILAAT
jgi:hypothetical protein